MCLQCRSEMPKSQRKARDTPSCSFLWWAQAVVAPSQVSASTHTLSQGIGWQPFRDSERDKKHLRVQHCQQKPSRSQDMVQQGSFLPQRRKPVGAVGHGLPSSYSSHSQYIALPAGGRKLHPSWHAALLIHPFPWGGGIVTLHLSIG